MLSQGCVFARVMVRRRLAPLVKTYSSIHQRAKSILPLTVTKRDGEEAWQLLAEPDGLLPQGPEEEGQGEEQEAACPGATRTSTPHLTPLTYLVERSRKPSSLRHCLVFFASSVPRPSPHLPCTTRPSLTNSLLPCSPLWAFRAPHRTTDLLGNASLGTHQHAPRTASHPPRIAPAAAPFPHSTHRRVKSLQWRTTRLKSSKRSRSLTVRVWRTAGRWTISRRSAARSCWRCSAWLRETAH